jgi:hypothetical protein
MTEFEGNTDSEHRAIANIQSSKTLDNGFLQKYDVKLYGSDVDNYSIINDFLQENQSEEAFYIIDLGEIVNAYNNWIRLLPQVKLYYAVKCNPNPVILEALASLGANFDCASENEIKAINKPELLPSELLQQSYIFSPRFMSPVYNISLQIQSLVFLDELILQKYLFVFIRGKSFNVDYFTEQCQKLEQLKNEKGLKYLIIDFFDQETLWMAFKRASLTIMTPLSDGTPNSALEDMAAECPLIIPHFDYDADIFDGATFVLEENEPEQLALLIEKAIIAYPKSMIDLASDRILRLGNRKTEMKRLEEIYNIATS